MKKWAIIVSTYGNSKFRLTETIKSIAEGTKMPYDLWVRGASENYWQQCEQREVADKFGANFMESARWRHWELSNSVKTVKNPMIAFVKDDIIFPKGWLEAIDYFWENNPQIPIAIIGPAFIEAWELINAGILKEPNEIWSKKIAVTRAEFNKIAQEKNIKHHSWFTAEHPFAYFATCPFAYTIKRKDFFDWNGPYYVGPGDTTVIYSYLGLLHGKLPFYLTSPTVLHRVGKSSGEWWEYHKYDPKAKSLIWYSEELGKSFKDRWKMAWSEFGAATRKKFNEETAKHDLSNLKFLEYGNKA